MERTLIERGITMTESTKKLLIFSAGAAIGSAVTYFATKEHFKKQADEEIKSVVAHFRCEDLVTEEDAEQAPDDESEGFVERLTNERYEKLTKNYSVPQTAQKPKLSDYPREEDFEILTPTIITIEEFAEGFSSYDQETMYYYTEDNTLCDCNEEIVDNPKDLVGDALLAADNEDENVIYVRNGQIAIDYEIIIVRDRYAKVVAGMTDEEIQGQADFDAMQRRRS